MIDRRSLLGVLSVALIMPLIGLAQPAVKLPRVGMLLPGTPGSITPIQAGGAGFSVFEDQLRALGWIEGRNVLLERRYAEERYERYPQLAVELVRINVDVIVPAGGSASLKAAMDATKTIPIVMVASSRDPIGEGLIKSFARPGGNVTGLVTAPAEIGSKQLELLKEAVPALSRVGIIWDASLGPFRVTKQVDDAARSLGVEVLGFDVRGPADFERAIADARKSQAGALVVSSTPLLVTHRREIAELLGKLRMPAIALWRSQAEAGLLMTYGPSITSEFRSAAIYVDKILKGAKPGDLPVEQPTKYDLVINMKTAKALGLAIPPSLLLRADEVIQ
ncbi:MAG TPA: ABC transporter substrate-binding protein [Casimicrobiaceae bacterium]|nr:ABC transporter substrate-binding protein [Casimicrobiaceae bacterium]